MKILVNASTLIAGGGVQVAINFIKYSLINHHQYYYLLSYQVHQQLSKEELSKMTYYLIETSPAKYIKGKTTRNDILKIEKKVNPDIVYSIGSPSYIAFKNVEVLRLTNPWIIGGSTKFAYTKYPILLRFKIYLKTLIQRQFIKQKHIIITQTETAKTNMFKTLKIKPINIHVIPNVHATIFNRIKPVEKVKKKINILVFAAPYPHKNLDLIPEVVYQILKKGISNFKFTVTIPENKNPYFYKNFQKQCKFYKVESYIENIGKVDFKDVPKLYQNSDILFLPTLLEIFSVTYLEAMASSVPIVTTDLPFSKEVCKNAAFYFKPKNALDAATKIDELIESEEVREKLISFGKNILLEYPKANEIYAEHVAVLEHVYKSNS